MSTQRESQGDRAVIEVRNLTKEYGTSRKVRHGQSALVAVSDVSFSIRENEIVSLVGESGCGKTTIARMILHVIKPSSGSIVFDGKEVQHYSERQFRSFRGDVQMIYQNPFDCLNPSKHIASLLDEPLRLWHSHLSPAERRHRMVDMLEQCGLDAACLEKRPPEFSGGQLQRISIARALLVRPRLLVADEIVSALDVPIQNQILQLLLDMKDEYRFSTLFITHDLAVARKVSDRVIIMNRGSIVDEGPIEEVLDHSNEPYVRKLAESSFTFRGCAD